MAFIEPEYRVREFIPGQRGYASVTLKDCSTCGALVHNKAVHTEYHRAEHQLFEMLLNTLSNSTGG